MREDLKRFESALGSLQLPHKITLTGVYYSLAVWRFDPILSVGLWKNAPFLSGWRLRFHSAVAENRVVCSRLRLSLTF